MAAMEMIDTNILISFQDYGYYLMGSKNSLMVL